MKYFKYDSEGNLEEFEVESFLKDYEYNVTVYQSLVDQLNELTEIYGTSADKVKVQTSKRTDGVDNLVLRIFSLNAKIAEYQAYFFSYSRALGSLSENEQKIIRIFYGGAYPHPLSIVCREFHIEKSEAYRRRNKALKKVHDFIVGDENIVFAEKSNN